ncbi:hypothetical protein [Halostagnicola sp. A-GB9-2]|uniref:hypothetical protein n=1 Tax=Halostagnicola sp. A-GB9-2 TaxID=3048066 RepID=UPI0024C03476|nr:hypothetical protein [Halostagnicola sp. A-GB9-2]MDJ1433973.1 hypothetical protein [Halostagnicola sp. A-GB9-2]
MAGAFDVQWTGIDDIARKIVFEPLANGGHMRIEYRWTGNKWVPEGREPVEEVNLECASRL